MRLNDLPPGVSVFDENINPSSETCGCAFQWSINDDGDRERCGNLAIVVDLATEEERCADHTDEVLKAEEARWRRLYEIEAKDARYCSDCNGLGIQTGWTRDKLGIYECTRCGETFDEDSALDRKAVSR